MWYAINMNSSVQDEMLVDASLADSDHFHALIAHDTQPLWIDSATGYKSPGSHTSNNPYHSFDWAPLDNSDGQYTPPALGSSRLSYELGAGPDGVPSSGYMRYQEGAAFAENAHYMAPTYGSSRPAAQMTGEPNAFNNQPRNSPEFKREPRSLQKAGLEVPKRPRLHRRCSDQSTSSLKNSSNTNEKCNGNSSVTNEAHIIAERRYRNNLNAKISQIQTALQEAKFRSHSGESYRSRGGTYFNSDMSTTNDADATSPNSSGGKDRRRKADILDEAAEYIRYADLELRHLSEEVQWLNQALAATQGHNYDPQHRQHLQ